MRVKQVLTFFIFFLALALLHLTLSTKRIDLEFQMQKLEEARAEWKGKREQLLYDVARLSSLARIEAFARTHGMVRPERRTLLVVPSLKSAKK